MQGPLVLFHANCPDGFCAAWVAHRQFGDHAEYVPVQYGQEPPDVTGRDVLILDFSYKRPIMLDMARKATRLIILDHHKTAAAELANLSRECDEMGIPVATVIFDMEQSGGRLTWEYFYPYQPSPWLVDYTEDRDLWRWKLDSSKEISAFIASHPRDFALWDKWATYDAGCEAWYMHVDAGAAILRYQSQQVDSICANAREVELDGYKVLAVNTSVLFSEVAGKLAEDRPFGAAWFERGDGKIQWSLRSRDGGVDVSEVAKRRGGGGHRNAAGFEMCKA